MIIIWNSKVDVNTTMPGTCQLEKVNVYVKFQQFIACFNDLSDPIFLKMLKINPPLLRAHA